MVSRAVGAPVLAPERRATPTTPVTSTDTGDEAEMERQVWGLCQCNG